MKHYLLTRYNCGLYSGKGFVDRGGISINTYADEWMRHRFGLFVNICLPSIEGQIDQDFEWLIFLDKDTPKEFREQIEACRIVRDFKILFDKEEAREESVKYIRENVKDGICITSRVDNDDALHKEFIKGVKYYSKVNVGNAIVFKNGTYYDVEDKQQSEYSYPLNPFMSLVEPYDHINVVWSVDHGSIREIAKEITEIRCGSFWLSTVHKYNRKNNLRGSIVNCDSKRLKDKFSINV